MSLFSNPGQNTGGLFGQQNQGQNTGGLFGQQNQGQNTGGLFGQQNQGQNTGGLFGNNQSNQTQNLFGNNQSTNNKQGNTLFGANNPTNLSFGAGGNNLFNNSNNNQSSNTASFLGGNNTTTTQTNNLFSNIGQNNNNNAQQQKSNNILGNLSGINSNNNNQNNNIFQQNNLINNQNQARNQLLNLNNPKIKHDLEEYKQVLQNVSNCTDPSQIENMFKDYLYLPIPKGTSPNDANVYRPYTIVGSQQQKIINDYNIWEQASKNNVDPNKFFPVQISSVDALLQRYKNIEKGILESIARTVETQKNLENLNKKIDDEMNNKILELKNCHVKLEKLQLSLSSKVAQYNYLLGTAKENVNDTKQIKENIKKANDNIKKNNMIEVSEKIKKISNEEIGVENKDYIKEVNKDKINYMMDALVEIQNMMNVINSNNKKNLNIVNGMQKEVDRILKKNEI